MRDPLSWSFPIGRLFGISIRVHVLVPVIALGFYMRVAFDRRFPDGTALDVLMLEGMAFLAVLLHEFGHCFAGRSVGGEAREILMWPLGGLAYVDVPHEPRANLITAIWGPLVNVILCVLCGLAMIFLLDHAYRPTWNPFWNPLFEPVYLWDGSAPPNHNPVALILGRFFWINWYLFLFNIILVGFPLDGGRILQCILWSRIGYRQATMVAVYSGFVVMFLLCIVGIFGNEVLLLFLALFMYTSCKQEWIQLETGGEESLFGYDFSQGYTSLERGEDGGQPASPPQPPKKKLNFIQRWLQRRAAKKLQREKEQQEADDRRMDELLQKIKDLGGIEKLTSEERRFLDRMSNRYKNRP